MTCATSLYPWEAPALAGEMDAEMAQLHRDEHDAWLDGFLAEAYEAWLDDVVPDPVAEPAEAWLADWDEDVAAALATVADPAYVPFQHTERYAQLHDEIGYAESVTPWLY